MNHAASGFIHHLGIHKIVTGEFFVRIFIYVFHSFMKLITIIIIINDGLIYVFICHYFYLFLSSFFIPGSVRTEMATRVLLHKMRALLEDAMESGSLEKREYEDAIREVGFMFKLNL